MNSHLLNYTSVDEDAVVHRFNNINGPWVRHPWLVGGRQPGSTLSTIVDIARSVSELWVGIDLISKACPSITFEVGQTFYFHLSKLHVVDGSEVHVEDPTLTAAHKVLI